MKTSFLCRILFFCVAVQLLLLFSCSRKSDPSVKPPDPVSPYAGTYILTSIFAGGTESGNNILDPSTSSGNFSVSTIDNNHLHIVLSTNINGKTSSSAEDVQVTGPDPQNGSGFIDFVESDQKAQDHGFFEIGNNQIYIHVVTGNASSSFLIIGGPKTP